MKGEVQHISKRHFLKQSLAAIAALTLNSVMMLTPASIAHAGQLEKEDLKFGFIKLTDMAPLAIAYEKGFFEDEGLYVTLEPCPMCAAALVHARVARLVFGAWDPRQGAAGSAFNLVTAREMNHQVDCFGGVLSDECGSLLKRFFASRR